MMREGTAHAQQREERLRERKATQHVGREGELVSVDQNAWGLEQGPSIIDQNVDAPITHAQPPCDVVHGANAGQVCPYRGTVGASGLSLAEPFSPRATCDKSARPVAGTAATQMECRSPAPGCRRSRHRPQSVEIGVGRVLRPTGSVGGSPTQETSRPRIRPATCRTAHLRPPQQAPDGPPGPPTVGLVEQLLDHGRDFAMQSQDRRPILRIRRPFRRGIDGAANDLTCDRKRQREGARIP